MQEDNAPPFSISGDFEVGPHLYSYLHRLSFSLSGSVEMIDGTGQHIIAVVKGRFAVQRKDHCTAVIHFSDLVDLKLKSPFLIQFKDPDHPSYEGTIFVENPDYHNEEPLRMLAPISVLVTREEGLFPFVKIAPVKQEPPCLLYRARYVFECDPLEQVRDRREAGYDQVIEEPDTRYYYRRDEVQELTTEALEKMGISLL